MIRITVLMDNYPSGHFHLKTAHGFCCYVEAEGRRYLFDCGPDGQVLYNARMLRCDLTKLDAILLSHGHYDHVAGLYDLAEAGVRGPVYVGNGFWAPKYLHQGIADTYVGPCYDRQYLLNKGFSVTDCGDRLDIGPKAHLVSGFQRKSAFEKIPDAFMKGEPPALVPDDFSDEICLVLDGREGLIVVTGCAHPGIRNMISSIRQRFQRPVYAVVGGTHLMDADAARIEETAGFFQREGIRVAGLSHCTGELAKARFQELAFPGSDLCVGATLTFPS